VKPRRPPESREGCTVCGVCVLKPCSWFDDARHHSVAEEHTTGLLCSLVMRSAAYGRAVETTYRLGHTPLEWISDTQHGGERLGTRSEFAYNLLSSSTRDSDSRGPASPRTASVHPTRPAQLPLSDSARPTIFRRVSPHHLRPFLPRLQLAHRLRGTRPGSGGSAILLDVVLLSTA
jgi:hypothetical protein